MKKKLFCIYLLITIIDTSCSSNKQSNEGLPVIDLRKDYPEKELILTDIAEVTYVHLSSKEDDYLYQGTIKYVSENTIIVVDESSGSVLFFTKDGTPKSRFNRYGNGPQEYSSGASAGFSFIKSVKRILYDEKSDEVFIGAAFHNILKVYSSSGKYLRTINCPPQNQDYFFTYTIDFFDNQSFIIYDADSFYIISRMNGKVLEYVEIPNSEVNLLTSVEETLPGGEPIIMVPRGSRMIKSTDGFTLHLTGTDTVYYFNEKKILTPILSTTPLARNLSRKIILDNFWDIDKYQFMRIHTMHFSNYRTEYPDKPYPDRYVFRDKKTGEVFRQKIILPDYKGKEIFISTNPLNVFQEKTTYIELNLMELKDAYRADRLSGKLKELVSTLNEEEDNNVFMFIEFK